MRPRPATDQVKGTKPAKTRVNRPRTSTTIPEDRAAPPSSLRKRLSTSSSVRGRFSFVCGPSAAQSAIPPNTHTGYMCPTTKRQGAPGRFKVVPTSPTKTPTVQGRVRQGNEVATLTPARPTHNHDRLFGKPLRDPSTISQSRHSGLRAGQAACHVRTTTCRGTSDRTHLEPRRQLGPPRSGCSPVGGNQAGTTRPAPHTSAPVGVHKRRCHDSLALSSPSPRSGASRGRCIPPSSTQVLRGSGCG